MNPAPGAGNSWFRAFARLGAANFLLNGMVFRHEISGQNGSTQYWNPNPWNVGDYGPTDLPNRTGALPWNAQMRPTATHAFMPIFVAVQMFGLKYGPLADDPQRNDNDATLRQALTLARMARANHPTQPRKVPSYFPLLSVGLSGINDPPASDAAIEAGHLRWLYVLNFPTGGPAPHEMTDFQCWSAQYCYRDSADVSMLDVVAHQFGVEPGNEVGIFNALDGANSFKWAQNPNNYVERPVASDSGYWFGVMAELIHRREQRTT